jgi:hypothetical protein
LPGRGYTGSSFALMTIWLLSGESSSGESSCRTGVVDHLRRLLDLLLLLLHFQFLFECCLLLSMLFILGNASALTLFFCFLLGFALLSTVFFFSNFEMFAAFLFS